MLHKLIDHSPDLKRLRDEGYEIQIVNSYIVIHNIPYVNSKKQIDYGKLISELTIEGVKAGKPKNHVILFEGEQPCFTDGTVIKALVHTNNRVSITDDLEADRSFSNKPASGFSDYYSKVTNYVNIICGPAQSLDNLVTPRTYRLIDDNTSDLPYEYPDTNSSRAEISAITEKLQGLKIGIIGLGGSGSYLLDLISKTPVAEIHIFDDDEFLLHNAFRAPGAPRKEDLKNTKKKVLYFEEIYSRMHRGVKSYSIRIERGNLHLLDRLDTVFISVDNGQTRQLIFEYLAKKGITFIDLGIGVERIGTDNLSGLLRVSTALNGNVGNLISKGRIPFSDENDEDEYSQNIQIAELNALNAVLAVIKWKKIYGFYVQDGDERHSLYVIEDNTIFNEDLET